MKKILLCISLCLLNSCSSSSVKNDEKATEVPNKDVVQTDLPQNELFQKSKRLYENALYTTSQESFQSLRDAYSPGPYAEFAEIKLADSHFELQKYDTAATTYEEFIKNHPSSPSLPYAMLRAGRSYELYNKGTGRDIAPLEKAKDHYEKLVEQYPESVYSYAGRRYYQSIVEKLSDHELFVLDFYHRKDNQEAIAAREKRYNVTIQPLIDKANYQNSEAFEDSLKAKKKDIKNMAPQILEVQRVSSIAVKRKIPSNQEGSRVTDEIKSNYRIQTVKCDRNQGRSMYIFLDKEFTDQSFLNNNAIIEEKSGSWSLKLPEARSKEMTISCFGESDLTVSQDATISLNAAGKGSLLALINPPRLLVSFE